MSIGVVLGGDGPKCRSFGVKDGKIALWSES